MQTRNKQKHKSKDHPHRAGIYKISFLQQYLTVVGNFIESMKTTLVILIFIFIATTSKAQGFEHCPVFDRVTIDTIRLTHFNAKKVVAFSFSGVTICVNYAKVKKDLQKNAEKNRELLGDTIWAASRGLYVDKSLQKKYKETDSLYNYIFSQINQNDTVAVFQKDYPRVWLARLLDFDKMIESNKCLILDEHRIPQLMIIRKAGSISRGYKEMWGGRSYSLPEREKCFLSAMDMAS